MSESKGCVNLAWKQILKHGEQLLRRTCPGCIAIEPHGVGPQTRTLSEYLVWWVETGGPSDIMGPSHLGLTNILNCTRKQIRSQLSLDRTGGLCCKPCTSDLWPVDRIWCLWMHLRHMDGALFWLEWSLPFHASNHTQTWHRPVTSALCWSSRLFTQISKQTQLASNMFENDWRQCGTVSSVQAGDRILITQRSLDHYSKHRTHMTSS